MGEISEIRKDAEVILDLQIELREKDEHILEQYAQQLRNTHEKLQSNILQRR